MADHSIEILGQKFTYPSTWQGTTAVFIVCSMISFVAWTLEPEQINSYKGFMNGQIDKEVEEKLIKLNTKLGEQIKFLNTEVTRLTKNSTLNESEKDNLKLKISDTNKDIKTAYDGLISAENNRKNYFNEILKNSDIKQQKIINLEKARIETQLNTYKEQKTHIK